jgi:argininosuccinate lyase
VLTGAIGELVVDDARLAAAAAEGATTAVAMADALVDKGVAFRAAHHVVGALVLAAERRGVGLAALPDENMAGALSGSDDPVAIALAGDAAARRDILAAATIPAALARADVIGGTAPARVADELAKAAQRLGLD